MPHKLLLADDSVTIQRVIELTFADEDIQVIAVGDGKQAIERIELDRPDIVLADVGMPERDGYEVAAFVKNTPHLSHIPVLLLTGAFEPVDEQRASAVGCDGVLAKPFEPQMVITRVKELLADARPVRQVAAQRRTEDLRPPMPLTPPPPAASPAPVALTTRAASTPTVPLEPPAVVPPEPMPIPESRVKTVELEVAPSPAPAVPEIPLLTSEPAAVPKPAPTPAPTPAPQEARPATVESPLDAAVRISRRTPIAVPGFGAPSLPAAGQSAASLDDYFDRLDAAFASLHQGPEGTHEPPSDVSDTMRMPSPVGTPAIAPDADTLPWRRPGRPAEPERPQADAVAPDADTLMLDRRTAMPVPAQAPAPTPAPPPVAPESSHAPVIAQAFSALFAAERGEVEAPMPSFYPPPPQESTEELVERVTEQVLQRLSDRVVRETVTDIVSRVAERLVREEIDRVKSTIK
ncbi:MAG: response regulator [Acidobacteria bacterium]|nr:response regulator [Acidobacteriota bacterium]